MAYNEILITILQINNRSIQDMQIFGDPLRTPIVVVEHVLNVPRRFPSENSLLSHIGSIDSDGFPFSLNTAPPSNARVLKIVVFVHGFQACLVDFIAKLYLVFLGKDLFETTHRTYTFDNTL